MGLGYSRDYYTATKALCTPNSINLEDLDAIGSWSYNQSVPVEILFIMLRRCYAYPAEAFSFEESSHTVKFDSSSQAVSAPQRRRLYSNPYFL